MGLSKITQIPPESKEKTAIVTDGYYVCPHLLAHFTVKMFYN